MNSYKMFNFHILSKTFVYLQKFTFFVVTKYTFNKTNAENKKIEIKIQTCLKCKLKIKFCILTIKSSNVAYCYFTMSPYSTNYWKKFLAL